MRAYLLVALLGAAILPLGGTYLIAADNNWTSVQHNDSPQITGSGRVIRQARQISAAQAVELSGAADVEVRVGPAPSLVVEADDNLLPLFTSEVRGGTLKLASKGSYRTRNTPRFFVTLPSINSLQTSGSGDAVVIDARSSSLALGLKGSGNIRASGSAGLLDASIHGSGNLDLRQLAAGDAKLAIYGSGEITAAPRGKVEAITFGSGDIDLLSRPASLEVRRGGSGSVRTSNR